MVIYMKLKNNLFKFKNIVFLLVLVVLGTSSLVGLSYVFGVDKYFNDYTKNSIDSRLVYVGIKNIKNKANLNHNFWNLQKALSFLFSTLFPFFEHFSKQQTKTF